MALKRLSVRAGLQIHCFPKCQKWSRLRLGFVVVDVHKTPMIVFSNRTNNWMNAKLAHDKKGDGNLSTGFKNYFSAKCYETLSCGSIHGCFSSPGTGRL